MLHVYTGTDRQKARAALSQAVQKVSGKNGAAERVTEGPDAALQLSRIFSSRGLFGGTKIVVIDGVFENAEARQVILDCIESIAQSEDTFFLFEEKIDAVALKQMKKHLASYEIFNAPKKAETNVFKIANALKAGERKALWLSYVEQLSSGNAPEALHGIMFWGAKQMLLSAREGTDSEKRAKKLVAELAELPHVSRRKGVELEYALENFILNCA